MAADNQNEKTQTGNSSDDRPIPSQAEGDEQTVEESLRQKEGKR